MSAAVHSGARQSAGSGRPAPANASSSAPEHLECTIPGKRRFKIWTTTFEIDAKYEVRTGDTGCNWERGNRPSRARRPAATQACAHSISADYSCYVRASSELWAHTLCIHMPTAVAASLVQDLAPRRAVAAPARVARVIRVPWAVTRASGRTLGKAGEGLTPPAPVQPIKGVGKGAYGVVCSARVAGSGDKVAIKKIQNAFENETDARRTLREVTLLRQLRHENVIKLTDIMQPPGSSKEHFRDVYLVYELMDTDLHQIIRSKQPLSDEHFQYFLYQVRSRPAGGLRVVAWL